jgi:transposase-like protein
VSEVAFDLEISDQTIYSWLRQDRRQSPQTVET